MEENIVGKIREFVEGECKKPSANYPTAYKYHFIQTHQHAKRLAEMLNADVEVVEIAAWIHDIGSILYRRADHHITGAEIADKKLRELKYPEEKIILVKKCILNHRGSIDNPRESIEEQIIAEADAITAFDFVEGLFSAAFVTEKLSREEAKESVRRKLQNKWNQLTLEESKRLVKPRYEAFMLLLN
jgi:uncharacterized protein